MTKFIVLAVSMGALATGAFAAGEGDTTQLDGNGDGVVSIEELQAVYPEISAEQFSQIDTNGDSVVDADELSAAQGAGLLPEAPATTE